MKAALVIAVRGGPEAKSRCAPVLGPASRQALVAAMLEDMLKAAAATVGLGPVFVATPTAELAERAERRGALALVEEPPFGLNAAFAAGLRRARTETDGPVLLLPGDLPLVGPAELEMAARAVSGGSLLLAPSLADGGTGAVGLPAGTQIPLMFGFDSFRRHLAAARALATPLQLIEGGALGLDIDRPEDLGQILLSPATHSAAVLRAAQAPLRRSA
ncbi:MAG TPA: 2-phospho-L-lactate guanylyltransferase [Caulobacter sp.]|nr:2-phospho-L-lactate guanylyltransferase [Caulobacter sp.]